MAEISDHPGPQLPISLCIRDQPLQIQTVNTFRHGAWQHPMAWGGSPGCIFFVSCLQPKQNETEKPAEKLAEKPAETVLQHVVTDSNQKKKRAPAMHLAHPGPLGTLPMEGA